MSPRDEWLWGWDDHPGIVSVWAEPDGRAWIWRRVPMAGGQTAAEPGAGTVVRETARFRPWILCAHLEDVAHLGAALRPEREGASPRGITWEELEGPGELRYLLRGEDGNALLRELLRGASRRLGRPVSRARDLGAGEVLSLPPEEQYLVMSGRAYFRGLAFDDLHRMQLDLETTGLDPDTDQIFLVALRYPDGRAETLEIAAEGAAGERDLLQRALAAVAAADPDVIENHNLHGFDLPFLARRAQKLGVTLSLGRAGGGLRQRPSARGRGLGEGAPRRTRATVPGRELIDTMDAVRRHDFVSRELPSHGLKAVAKHLGLAREDREHVPGSRIHAVWRSDPERVRRYAEDDVHEAEALARTLGGATFALARMVPRRYERLADAGPATGILDPLLVRAYLRERAALPAPSPGDGTPHHGAALHLFATGVAERVVKADVASLYPSLMRQYRIGPARDHLGVLLALVDHLVEQRLAAKARGKEGAAASPEKHTNEAISAALKLVISSAYGYLGAAALTRFSDVHAANEITRRGRALLALLCRELSRRGVTLLEADTDGVYFAVPKAFTEADERRVVAEVAALLPPLVKLEFDGRYAAMLSHEPKNYALLAYPRGRAPESSGAADSQVLSLRGVAFRSSRAEPYGESFLRTAIAALLRGEVRGVRSAYVSTVLALRRRSLATFEVTARVRLTKSPEEYLAIRSRKRELPYEAMLAAGRTGWRQGERVRVYRTTNGRAGLLLEDEDGEARADPRDYDVEHYVRLLRETFAARLARGLSPEDFALVVHDPAQTSLFEDSLRHAKPRLTPVLDALGEAFEEKILEADPWRETEG